MIIDCYLYSIRKPIDFTEAARDVIGDNEHLLGVVAYWQSRILLKETLNSPHCHSEQSEESLAINTIDFSLCSK